MTCIVDARKLANTDRGQTIFVHIVLALYDASTPEWNNKNHKGFMGQLNGFRPLIQVRIYFI